MTRRKPNDFGDLDYADRSSLTTMLRKGATRRDAMRMLMAAGLSVTASGLIVSSATTALANTPKRGGRLKMAIDSHGPDDQLDPANFRATVDYFRGRMFYGSLTRLQEDLSYAPELAEEVIPNDDATEWTFKLRKGVEFHNGKTMTADDVLYSMNRHIGPDTVSAGASLVSMIKEWTKVNDHEVKAILDRPNADLPIALGTFHFKILPDGYSDFSTTTIGTGPYKVKEFKPGVRCIGARFDNYWEDGGYLDELEHFGIGDPVARVNALLNGDVDAIGAVSPKAIGTVEAADGISLWALKSGGFINIAGRVDTGPGENQHVIMALKHLQDRNRVVKGVLKGHGSLGNDQPIGPAYFDHCPDIPQRELDLDKAKWHFEQSGIGNTEIPITAAEIGAGVVEMATSTQREAEKIGMNVTVKKVAPDGYWSAVWLKDPFCVVRWNPRPTANIMMSLTLHSDAKWNESYWKNEQFDQLLTDVLAVTDPAKRKQMYCDMQTLVHETGGTILPAHLDYVDAAADYVKGRTYVPLNHFGGAESPPTLWRDDA
ncbi:MAG: ABC transporter substrate-binding protein [Pseudomonadota bacterium]